MTRTLIGDPAAALALPLPALLLPLPLPPLLLLHAVTIASPATAAILAATGLNAFISHSCLGDRSFYG